MKVQRRSVPTLMGVITSWNFLDPYVYQNVDIMGNIILLCSSMKLDIVNERVLNHFT